MYTCCTHCKTWFALRATQLRIGRGEVRCGHCYATFNALEWLSDEAPPELRSRDTEATYAGATNEPEMGDIRLLGRSVHDAVTPMGKVPSSTDPEVAAWSTSGANIAPGIEQATGPGDGPETRPHTEQETERGIEQGIEQGIELGIERAPGRDIEQATDPSFGSVIGQDAHPDSAPSYRLEAWPEVTGPEASEATGADGSNDTSDSPAMPGTAAKPAQHDKDLADGSTNAPWPHPAHGTSMPSVEPGSESGIQSAAVAALEESQAPPLATPLPAIDSHAQTGNLRLADDGAVVGHNDSTPANQTDEVTFFTDGEIAYRSDATLLHDHALGVSPRDSSPDGAQDNVTAKDAQAEPESGSSSEESKTDPLGVGERDALTRNQGVDTGSTPQRSDDELIAEVVDRNAQAARVDDGADLPPVLRASRYVETDTRRFTNAQWGMLALSLLLLLALLGQYLWFMPDDAMRRYPQLTGVVDALCEPTQCRRAQRIDRTQIELLSRDVRIHPTYEGALQVTLSMVNRAAFAQTYPYIEFTLFNVNGQTIVSRTFTPNDYAPEGDPAAELQPKAPVQVVLELLAPEEVAVSFEFRFI